MVSLIKIRKSNQSLHELPPGLVAVFAGATSGVGLATLTALAKYGNGPRVYLIGRDEKKVCHIIEKLKIINPMASFTFIEGHFSLIKDVDRMCEVIKSLEAHIDILCMSPGYSSLGGRLETQEGIETDLALQFYSRQRLTMNLLPLLDNSVSPRVISVLAPGFEGPIDKDDLDCRGHYSLIKASRAAATMTDLMFEKLSEVYPTVSFIHSYPGEVGSHLLDHRLASTDKLLWLPAQISRFTILPIYTHIMCITPEEAGERTLFLATSTRYPASTDHGSTEKIDGLVERPIGVPFAEATIMNEGRGNGVYRVNWDSEVWNESKMLDQYREAGLGNSVYDHTMGIFEDALNAVVLGNADEESEDELLADTNSLLFELDENLLEEEMESGGC